MFHCQRDWILLNPKHSAVLSVFKNHQIFNTLTEGSTQTNSCEEKQGGWPAGVDLHELDNCRKEADEKR